MMLKPYQIERILDLRRTKKMGVEAIAKITGHSKNTVKKYLRLNSLLPYQYPSDLHRGPPSLIYPSTWSTSEHELMQRGGRLVKKLDETFVLLNEANEQIQGLRDEGNQKDERYEAVSKELEDYKRLYTESQKEVQEERRQKDEISRQMNEELPRPEEKNKTLKSEIIKLNETIIYEREENHKKDQQLEDIRQKTLKYVEKINNFFNEYSKDQIKKYNDLLTAFEDYKRKHPEEKLRQPIAPQEIQADEETTSADNEDTENHYIKVDNYLAATAVTLIVGAIAVPVIKYILNKPATATISIRTPQPIIPILQCSSNQPGNPNVQPTQLPGMGFGEGAGLVVPVPLRGMIQPSIHSIDSGLTEEIKTSGISCSGAYYNNYEEDTSKRYDAIRTQQDDVNQPDHHNTVTIETNTLDIQCSEPFFSSHFEPINPQDVPPVQIPSSYQIPLNYYYISLPSPLPDDLSDVYPMRQLRKLKGIPFEEYMEKLFIYRGCPTERTPPTHDKGVDLIVTLDGKKTVIQCRQRPTVGIDAIQRIIAAKIHHKADRAMVITPGTFTKDALDEAQVLGVECWDGKRLLEEIYKDQFFHLPEN